VEKFQLTTEQLAQFEEDGFLVVSGVFDKGDLQPIKQVIDQWIDDVASELVKTGQLTHAHADLGLYERMAAIDKQLPGVSMGLQTSWMRDRLRVMEHPAMRIIRGNAKLLDVLEQIVGNEVAGHPNCTVRSSMFLSCVCCLV
jgi:hypothetical protein